MGLARSGRAAAAMLSGHGEVIGVDSGRPDGAAGRGGAPGDRRRGAARPRGLRREEPGRAAGGPVDRAARERGIPVHGELELAWRLLPNRFLAVTGTNGKTTTAELLGAIYRAAGLAVAVAGNVGTPLSSLVGSLDQDAVVVCECSSFQLEDAGAFAPDTRAAAQPGGGPPRPPRHGRGLQGGEAAHVRPPGRGDVAVAPPGIEPRRRWRGA